MADFSRVAGIVYIRLASNQITTDKKNDIESELLNWDNLDLAVEKFQIAKSEPQVLICTKGFTRETGKQVKGGGLVATIHKFIYDYYCSKYHNTICDICIYNSDTGRAAIAYRVLVKINIEMIANTNIKMLLDYEILTDYKRTYWNLLNFVSTDNKPLVKLLQFDYTNVFAEILNTGSSEIIESGFVFADTENPTTADTKIINTRVSNGFYYSLIQSNIVSFLTAKYARAYATNSNGTNYSNNMFLDAKEDKIKIGLIAHYITTAPIMPDKHIGLIAEEI